MYTDSHCHITDSSLFDRIDSVIDNMNQVSNCMIMCTDKLTLERALKIKEKDSRFKVASAWFCSDAKEITEEDIEYLKELANSHRIDCVGEIGLDYYWDTSFNDVQKDLFIKEIEIANEANLPIAIHMRDSIEDCMRILKEYAKTKIIFHCFSGSKETMMECLKMNSMISFAGPLTFKNARHAPECVIHCPLDRILTETDSPYLTPVPYRGKQNEPQYVEYVTKKICELKQIDLTTACSQISKNFLSLFQ